MKKNTFISIYSYPVLVIVDDLDVYLEYDKFKQLGNFKECPESEQISAFVDFLLEQERVYQPEDVASIPSGIPWYFRWDRVPTAEDMDDLRTALGAEQWGNIPIYHREIFATGYHQPLFKEAAFSKETYLKWLSDTSGVTLKDKLMAIYKSRMEAMMAMDIMKMGFTVQNVFSDDPVDLWKTFSYTIGASEKLGYDVVLVNGGTLSSGILTKHVSAALQTGGFELGNVIEDADFLIAGQPIRLMATEIPLDSITATEMLGAIKAGMPRAVQLFIGDKNNRLPGEEGYDELFVQILPPIND